MTHRARPPQLCSAQTTSAARQRRTVAVIFVYKMIKCIHKTSYKCINIHVFKQENEEMKGVSSCRTCLKAPAITAFRDQNRPQNRPQNRHSECVPHIFSSFSFIFLGPSSSQASVNTHSLSENRPLDLSRAIK